MSKKITDFHWSGDQKKQYATSNEGLPPGHQVAINGYTDLTNIINNDTSFGEVKSIILKTASSFSIFQYDLEIKARAHTLAASLVLKFTDETGDTYKKSIINTDWDTHTLSYRSDSPNITNISWSVKNNL